jgi:hypothetical protein
MPCGLSSGPNVLMSVDGIFKLVFYVKALTTYPTTSRPCPEAIEPAFWLLLLFLLVPWLMTTKLVLLLQLCPVDDLDLDLCHCHDVLSAAVVVVVARQQI